MDMQLFEDVLSVQSYTGETGRMRRFVRHYLDRLNIRYWVQDRNIYAIKGDAKVYPCVAAHLDTVHRIAPDRNYHVEHDEAGDIWWAWNPNGPNRKTKDGVDLGPGNYTGIGGDDKCGIFIALQLMTLLPVCKMVLFRDEENGCNGARQANMTFFNDVSMVLEADRRGNKDFVSRGNGIELQSQKFKSAVKPILDTHGYKDCTWGASTDVIQLKKNKPEGLKVVCANASAGYYDPHTNGEFISALDVENCLWMFHAIFTQLGGEVWAHEMPTYDYKSYYPQKPIVVHGGKGAATSTGSNKPMPLGSGSKELRDLYPDLYRAAWADYDADAYGRGDWEEYAHVPYTVTDSEKARTYLPATRRSKKGKKSQVEVTVEALTPAQLAMLEAFEDMEILPLDLDALPISIDGEGCEYCGRMATLMRVPDVGIFCWTCCEWVGPLIRTDEEWERLDIEKEKLMYKYQMSEDFLDPDIPPMIAHFPNHSA
jgi:tripeptide aminopeptidase